MLHHLYNRCAIDLPSSVPWHGVDQFLASKIYPIGLSNLIGAIRQGHFVIPAAGHRRIRDWPQVNLMRLIERRTLQQ
jgi:hypothetical protein